MNNILVIIVTYNGKAWLDRCISSVLHSRVKADVIVIDNGSSDGTIEHIRDKYPTVKLYESHENLGFGKANNIGLNVMSPSWISLSRTHVHRIGKTYVFKGQTVRDNHRQCNLCVRLHNHIDQHKACGMGIGQIQQRRCKDAHIA